MAEDPEEADETRGLYPDCAPGFWAWLQRTDSEQGAAVTRMRVVVPMRNAAGTIGAALRSVNASAAALWSAAAAAGAARLEAVEAVVVDDASSDGGAAAVRAFADACAAGASLSLREGGGWQGAERGHPMEGGRARIGDTRAAVRPAGPCSAVFARKRVSAMRGYARAQQPRPI